MKMLSLFLALLCLCTCTSFIAAVEYQPTAQEWADMITLAESTERTSAIHLHEIQEYMENEKRHPGGDETILKEHEALLGRIQKTHDDLMIVLAGVKALNTNDRTRQNYLRFLHPIKRAAYQCTLDREEILRESISPGRGSIITPDLIRELRTKGIVPAPLPKGLKLSWADFPKLDGSTTAQPLSTLIACRLLGMGAEWYIRRIEDLRNSEGTSERILIPCLGRLSREDPTDGMLSDVTPVLSGLRVEMAHSGTGSAYNQLIYGNADLIIVARAPSPDEIALAQKQRIEFELRPIAYDAFIFLLNAKNPVSSLTVKQLQDIYTDNVLNWSELGGKEQPIVAFQRERNSGSQEMMESLVMKGMQMAPPLSTIIGYGMGGPYNKMRDTENGISYTFYYYHTVQSPESLASMAWHGGTPTMKVCAVNGIVPSAETIHNRSYPFVTEVYAVVRKDTPRESSAVRLRDWLLTPEGQAVVKESGYVPLP